MQRADSDSWWESDEECLPRLPGASPQPAKQHHGARNERTPQPARPPALQVVKAAVAANPAREVWVPRNETLHNLTLRELEHEVQPAGSHCLARCLLRCCIPRLAACLPQTCLPLFRLPVGRR